MAKGYSLDALVLEKWSRYTTPLGSGANLDTLSGVENAGIYMVSSNTVAGTIPSLPVKMAGILEVLPWSGANNIQSVQRYTLYNTGEEYSRCQPLVAGSWTPWVLKINANNIYNAIYPIGIVLQFDNATNPNNVFTGTVWEQITDGRTARAATGPEAGTADGQIGSTAGSDTANIAVTNLPGHTHGMQNHTHGIASHSHTMAHTHTINHDHGAVNTNTTGNHTHSLSGSTSTNGNHSHSITVREADGSGAAIADSDGGGIARTTYTGGAGNHSHTISGTANTAGNHYHSVDLPNFTGTSGGSSAGSTGGTALTSGGPSNNTTTSTGDGTALIVRNSSHYYAFWKRVA